MNDQPVQRDIVSKDDFFWQRRSTTARTKRHVDGPYIMSVIEVCYWYDAHIFKGCNPKLVSDPPGTHCQGHHATCNCMQHL